MLSEDVFVIFVILGKKQSFSCLKKMFPSAVQILSSLSTLIWTRDSAVSINLSSAYFHYIFSFNINGISNNFIRYAIFWISIHRESEWISSHAELVF